MVAKKAIKVCGDNSCHSVAKYLVSLLPVETWEADHAHTELSLRGRSQKTEYQCVCWFLLITFAQESQKETSLKNNLLALQVRNYRTIYPRNLKS